MISRLTQLTSKLDEKLRSAMAKTPATAKLIEAINEDPWGPTVPQMDELMEMYPDNYMDLQCEMQRFLDQRDASWRKCYKTLLLIDHLARNLDIRFVDELRFFAATLTEISASFRVNRDGGNDEHGLSVRERAKKVHELLTNDKHLMEERERADVARRRTAGLSVTGRGGDRFTGVSSSDSQRGFGVADVKPAVGRSTSGTSNAAAAQIDADHEYALKLQAMEDAKVRARDRAREEEDHRLAVMLQNGAALPASSAAAASTTTRGGGGGGAAKPLAAGGHPTGSHAAPSAAKPAAQQPTRTAAAAHDDFDTFVSARVAAGSTASTTATAVQHPAHPQSATTKPPPGWSPFDDLTPAPAAHAQAAISAQPTAWHQAPVAPAGSPAVATWSTAQPAPTMASAQPSTKPDAVFDFFANTPSANGASSSPAGGSSANVADPFADFVTSRVQQRAPTTGGSANAAPSTASGRAW